VIYDRALAEKIIDPADNPYEQAFNTLRRKGHSYMTYVFLLKPPRAANHLGPAW
jgi:hypothetical protein